MATREYVAGGTEFDARKFSDGTWRQPATFVRDMERFPTTAARLAGMRKAYPPAPDAPAGWTYDRAGGVGDPAYWFGESGGATMKRTDPDDRHFRPTLYYGEGIGGDIDRARPFRFVGFCDECKGGPDHTGWYGDDEGTGFTMFRGVVFRIPGRDGAERYMAGYEWGESSRKGFDSGGGAIECGRGDIYDDESDAARAADSLAENAAEREREYQSAENERIREEEEAAEREEAANHAERMEFTDVTGGGD